MKKILNFIIFGFILLVYLPIACNIVSKIDPKKFEKSHRALKSIEAKTLTGVSHIEFQKLMQDFLTEILIIKDSMRTNKEKEMLKQYTDIYDTYNDSIKLWEGQVKFNNLLLFAALYRDIVKKYNIETFPFNEYKERRGKALLLYDPAKSFREAFNGPDEIDTTPALAISIGGDTSMFDINQAINKIWKVAEKKIHAIKY